MSCCKLQPISGNSYKSCIYHAIIEHFFGMSCMYHAMTTVPNPRFQNTPHKVFHICYTSQRTVSHYHLVRWNLCVVPKNGTHKFHSKGLKLLYINIYHKLNQNINEETYQ